MSLCQYHTYFNFYNFASFEVRKYDLYILFFFKIILVLWGSLQFYMNFRISFSISLKEAVGILPGIMLNMYIVSGGIDILIMNNVSQVVLVVKNQPANVGDIKGVGLIPGWEDPWKSAWQPTPLFFPGESYGQRSLVGYSP